MLDAVASTLLLHTATGFLHPVRKFCSQPFHLQNIALETHSGCSRWEFGTKFTEKTLFSLKTVFPLCYPLARCPLNSKITKGFGHLDCNQSNEASLKVEPGTCAALGCTWPARTIPIRPHKRIQGLAFLQDLSSPVGRRPLCCKCRSMQREPEVSHGTSVAPRALNGQGLPLQRSATLLRVTYAFGQTDVIVDQTVFLLPCPTFSGGEALSKHFFSLDLCRQHSMLSK